MTERHDDSAASAGRPISTGEFRATPDISANTAQFRAFAEGASERERYWPPAAPGRNPARLAMLIGGLIIVVAIIAVVVSQVG